MRTDRPKPRKPYNPERKTKNQVLIEIMRLVNDYLPSASESDLQWLSQKLFTLSATTGDRSHDKPMPATPTDSKVGSEDKIQEMAARFARGENLYHSEDCILISDNQQSTEGDERW